MGLKEVIVFLGSLGFWDVLLPFFLVFLILYAVLQKTRVLGEENGKPKSNVNAAVSTMIGLMVVAFTSLVDAISLFVSHIALFLVAAVCVVIVAGMFGRTGEKPKGWLLVGIFGLVLIALLYAVGLYAKLDMTKIFAAIFNPLLIIAVVFIGVLYFVVREKTDGLAQPHTGSTNQNDNSNNRNRETPSSSAGTQPQFPKELEDELQKVFRGTPEEFKNFNPKQHEHDH